MTRLVETRELFISKHQTSSMPRYRVEYDRSACIGAASCAVADPVHFVISHKDTKADLKELTRRQVKG